MRGRKPKPSHLRLVEGTTPRNGKNAQEPRPRGALHAPPEDLTKSQKAIWTYAISNAPAGLLKRLDRDVLMQWAVSRDIYVQALKEQNKRKLIAETKDGNTYQSPWLAIMNKQVLLMLKLGSEMGFTPSSRTRIKVDEADTSDDPAEKYFADGE